MHAFKSRLVSLSSQVWAFGFFIPDQISNTLLTNQEKRVICTINDCVTYQCALMPGGDQGYFINVNRNHQKQLGVKEGEMLNIKLEPDKSEYGLPVAEELAELLKLDDDGSRVFHQLSAGKQRTLIHLIGVPKSSEIRMRRAITVLDYLKDVNGKLDFKELNIAIKLSNQRIG